MHSLPLLDTIPSPEMPSSNKGIEFTEVMPKTSRENNIVRQSASQLAICSLFTTKKLCIFGFWLKLASWLVYIAIQLSCAEHFLAKGFILCVQCYQSTQSSFKMNRRILVVYTANIPAAHLIKKIPHCTMLASSCHAFFHY